MFDWVGELLQGFYDFVGLIWFIITHPLQFLGFLICTSLNTLFSILPSTPDNLKIASLINEMGGALPLVGSGIIHELFTTVGAIVGILIIIKIYKLLPFKMS